MAQQEKNFLQSIKLEISRNFKLTPYERIAFHRILGILKTDVGKNILLNELERGPDIRQSALSILSNFRDEEVTRRLKPLLEQAISPAEMMNILAHLEENGGPEDIEDIISFLDKFKDAENNPHIIGKAFAVLKTIGAGSDTVLNYLLSLINSEEPHPLLQEYAILSLSAFRIVSSFEEILRRKNDTLSYYVFRSLYELNSRLIDSMQKETRSEEGVSFTYSELGREEDKIILDIRVLLGKMAPRFDEYSNLTKIAYISAMISCNHREFLIYIMKALTSRDPELISMTLYTLIYNVEKLRDPDKLFRSLIALSTESERDNELIVEIFVKFFTGIGEERKHHILKDKLYNYIVVTLETYFESYRREFMIKDVVEKSYPETIQKVRTFILERMTPELKKRIVSTLSSEDSRSAHKLLEEISRWVAYINEDEKEQLYYLMEVLFDEDQKSRENSAGRLEDINHEKRYLRSRIIRLCNIIARLHINDASSPLVNIYNYLKKYTDPALLHATIITLSHLNYSYMLGEIEVQLTMGNDEEKTEALRFISLYTEQRSLNILFEFLQAHAEEDTEQVITTLNIILEREIRGNATANQLLKKIIVNSNKKEILIPALLGLGKCGFDGDIEYLDKLFYRIKDNEVKDSIIRAIGDILSQTSDYNKRHIIRMLQEYLKDPGIRVRIYACLFLIQLGDTNALRSIREMLVIKNKNIQRDILTILGALQSIEFSFFLVSLLREEYGMMDDIISVLENLQEEELKEIDGFIVNIFRKFEAPDFDDLSETEANPRIIIIENLTKEEITILSIDILDSENTETRLTLPERITRNLRIKSVIASSIEQGGGTVSLLTHNRIIAFFKTPLEALQTSTRVSDNLNNLRLKSAYEQRINITNQIVTVIGSILGDELIAYPGYLFDAIKTLPLSNRVMIDQRTCDLVSNSFSTKNISELIFSETVSIVNHYEILSAINFKNEVEDLLGRINSEKEQREELEARLAEEIKKLKRGARSSSSVAITRDLEDIGNKLQQQLDEIERYIQRRSTDREMNRNVRKMLSNVYNLYKVEISRLIIE